MKVFHTFLIATLISFTLSFQVFGWGSPKPVQQAPAKVEAPVSAPSGSTVSFKLNVKAKASQVARITRLSGVAERIVNSEKFKVRVLNAWYNGRAQFQGTKLTNAQVLESIYNGNELGSGVDKVWNLEIGIEKNDCDVLGWTYPGVKMFWFNSCTFDGRDDAGVTGTICHEYTHKLGFDHDFSRTARRQYSVPYAIGTICAELYDIFK